MVADQTGRHQLMEKRLKDEAEEESKRTRKYNEK